MRQEGGKEVLCCFLPWRDAREKVSMLEPFLGRRHIKDTRGRKKSLAMHAELGCRNEDSQGALVPEPLDLGLRLIQE